MSRHTLLALVIVLGVVGVFASGHTLVGAQEATPNVIASNEVTAEQTRFGFVESVPPAPLSVDYYRITLPPGTKISGERGDPGLGLHVVESGTVTVTFDEDMPLTHNGEPNGVVGGGKEAKLGPGDGFIWRPPAGGEFRNDGADPAVVLVILLYPQGGTPVAGAAMATPAS